MKDKKNKKYEKLAQQIVKAEQELQENKNVQENQKLIEDIMSSLSFGEALSLDDYLFKMNMLTK